ncbi:hypothetical protein [Nitratireductor sp. XY-223]|uniref:hypothetical protein n=1 Tax=Nitratireductor sp. XY-223 TaxID=2561926 RepID=UPI0010A99773|nr:hypothetical protein [Nitratireductor sp. XY-223]
MVAIYIPAGIKQNTVFEIAHAAREINAHRQCGVAKAAATTEYASMGESVELPLWLVMLAGVLALVGLVDRLLITTKM